MFGTEHAGLRGGDRRRPWRRHGQDFKPIELPAPQITLCSPEEGEWRYEMSRAVCLEVGYDYDYPFDRDEKFLWQEGQRLLFSLNDKLHVVQVESRYTAIYRKKYWLKFENGWRLTVTEKQLRQLMQVAAARFRFQRQGKVSLAIVPAECKAIIVWKPEGIDAIGTPTSLAASPVSPPLPSIPPAQEKQSALSEQVMMT